MTAWTPDRTLRRHDPEWCADHGKPFPVVLPENQNLVFAPSTAAALPGHPGRPAPASGLNPYAGYTILWHSHTEKN